MYRILKDTGSIYLHCDNTMGHYIKILMDIVFGEKNFKNSIVWCYTSPANIKNNFPRKHDVIFFYSKKNNESIFNKDLVRIPYDSKFTMGSKKSLTRKNKQIGDHNTGKEEYIKKGKVTEDWWKDIRPLSVSKESVGYPTQKPIKLLERIIQACSNEGDIVLDPFCGCATTCVAAEKLHRQWIGIDVSVKAYELVKERLQKEVADPEKLTEYQNKIHYFTDPPKRTDTNGDDVRIKKYIYIISHPNYEKANLYKVGIASNLNSRLNSYQTSDPLREYKIEYDLHTPLFREIEEYIHKKFFSLMNGLMGN